MFTGALIGFSLVVTVAAEPAGKPPDTLTMRIPISQQQKDAAMRPLMRNATDCIVRAVASDPEFTASMKAGDINVLIVTSMAYCLEPMRTMIDAYDRLFGQGAGQAFFMGPYLDELPATVARQVAANPR